LLQDEKIDLQVILSNKPWRKKNMTPHGAAKGFDGHHKSLQDGSQRRNKG
jgi:hypothetical protein